MTTLAKCWAAYERDVLPKVVDQRHVEAIVKKWIEATNGSSVRTVDWHALSARRLDKGIQPSTLMREINIIRAVLRHGFKLNIIAKMPELPHHQIQSKAIGLTQNDIKEVLRRAKAHPGLDLFVRIGLSTGARPGAIMGLTWDRVDFERRTIDFNDPKLSKQGRRKKRAIVPMSNELAELLSGIALAMSPQPALGFVVPRFALNRIWRRHIGFWRPHALRHTVATEVARRFGLLAAANMLGHKSIRTTEQVYVHIQADHLREAAESLSTIKGT